MGLLSWVLGRVIGKMRYLKQQAERGDVEMMTCLLSSLVLIRRINSFSLVCDR